MKTFSTREIAQLKRTAQNVAPMVAKREKLYAKVKELYKEMEVLDAQIDAWEGGTKIMTGGYTTSDLVSRVVNIVTADDGKVTKTVSFVLKYPDTVLPPEEEVCVECCIEGMPDVVLAESPTEKIANVPFEEYPMTPEECLGEPDGPCVAVVGNN